jgi:hypothetical protein
LTFAVVLRPVVHRDEKMVIPKSSFVLRLEKVMSCVLSDFQQFLNPGVLRLAFCSPSGRLELKYAVQTPKRLSLIQR